MKTVSKVGIHIASDHSARITVNPVPKDIAIKI